MRSPTGRRRLGAVLVAAALSATLAGCAAGADRPEARVVVRIAPSAHPADYEVRLAQASGGFHARQRMRSGETRTFSVPSGWLTVRVPGVCVIPAAATGTTTVRIGLDDCTLA